MCMASSLVGVIVFIRRRSLIGEALSHATYPGVVFGVICAASLFTFSEDIIAFAILIGAFVFACLGLVVIEFLEKKLRVKNDAALCFTLSAFLGVGILFASRIQITHALWYQKIQVYLYGQAATMTDFHILLYGILALVITTFVILLFSSIKAVNFDREFCNVLGINTSWLDIGTFFLLILAIVIGIRSVGVVLMSGMLIAPAIAARQLTHKLSVMFAYAALIGLLSGFFGNYLSMQLPVPLPTGPMILLVAAFICFLSLFFAPERGLVTRLIRRYRFQTHCQLENALKAFWKKHHEKPFPMKKRKFIHYLLIKQGWVEWQEKNRYRLSSDGMKKAAHIVRLHRLWEVYLVNYLGIGEERVHCNAEEMEHIITPELEKKLTELLNDPKKDPHKQPIPERSLP